MILNLYNILRNLENTIKNNIFCSFPFYFISFSSLTTSIYIPSSGTASVILTICASPVKMPIAFPKKKMKEKGEKRKGERRKKRRKEGRKAWFGAAMSAMRARKENKLFGVLYRLIYEYKRQPTARDTEIDRVNYYGVCIVYTG